MLWPSSILRKLDGARFQRLITSPSMLSVADAEKLTVPLGIYISKDEPIEEV